jgi:hypothetical protein
MSPFSVKLEPYWENAVSGRRLEWVLTRVWMFVELDSGTGLRAGPALPQQALIEKLASP